MIVKYNLLTILGPTASGKTSFAAHLAYRLQGEIISADSRQVYRRMNLGTGKDYNDYQVEGYNVPVYLIDLAEPGYKYSIFEYQRDFLVAFNDITSRGKLPILCGGSGMYIDAVTQNYRLDEVPKNEVLRSELASKNLEELKAVLSGMKTLHNKSDIDTIERAVRAIEIETYYAVQPAMQKYFPELKTIFIGIKYDRETERNRITQRLYERIKQGMIEEVKMLLQSGIPAESLTYYGLEYRYITLYLEGKMDYRNMMMQLNTAIHQFSKRQNTWFRKMERHGCKIHWLDGNMPMDTKIEKVLEIIG